MTAAAKKKTKQNIRSTDRAGALLLPLGVMVIAFGMMLLLGGTLQTINDKGVLGLLKNMAIGLGGGLYLVFPLMFIWLGALLAVSSKRYVSPYAFTISLLLLLCIGAFMTLVVNVDASKANPRLMDYIREQNSFNKTPYPDSLGAYLRSAYQRYGSLRLAGGSYPGGGALSMLVAYPLNAAFGRIGGIAVLVIAIIALLFALFRVNPVNLMTRVSEKLNQSGQARSGREPQEAVTGEGDGLAAQRADGDAAYAAGWEESSGQAQWPAQAAQANDVPWQTEERYEQAPAARAWRDSDKPVQQAVAPGFVPQTAEAVFDEDGQQSFQANSRFTTPARRQPESPWIPAARHKEAADSQAAEDQGDGQAWGWPGNRQARSAAQPAPLHEEPVVQGSRNPVTDTAASAPEETPDNAAAKPRRLRATRNAETAAGPVVRETVTASPRETQNGPGETRQPATEAKTGDTPRAKPAGVEPAVPLTGERMPVARKTDPVKADTLDGMVKRPAATQIRIALDDYGTPPLRLLTAGTAADPGDTTEEDRVRAEKLIETLKSFSITAHLHDIVHGPTVTRFAIRLAEGINVNKLRNVMDNLTIELKAKGDIRAEMPIPGTSFVGLEVSNDKTSMVHLREVLESARMTENRSPTAVALGKDITGTPIVCELMDMPHLLIAGATGSGKSVCINSIICSMLYRASPRHVRMIMVDPKFVELQPYNDVPHLMMPVITDAKKATAALDWVCQEMDQRYQILVDAGVRNLDAYNRKLGPDEEPLPRIIVIVDEMADLMTTSGKMIEDHIKRITAKARAAGICLILATQRPSVNIITGVIKANIPGRIAFRVSSPFDSKTILDSQGAEKLLGYGDMLYRSQTRDPIRVQGCFVSDRDVEQTVEYIRSRNKADYNLDLMEHVEQTDQAENGGSPGDNGDSVGDGEFDDLLPQAIEMAVEAGQMSISMLQRVLRVGYARSGRLIDEMARRGIISGNEGTKARKTLMTREQYQNYLDQG